MDTEQARKILAAVDGRDNALRNLRNAAAMSAEDARSTEMLESAGTDYAVATAILDRVDREAVASVPAAALAGRVQEENPPDSDFALGKAVQIIDAAGKGAGFVEANVDGIAEGNVAVRLTTDATFRGEDFPAGATISVPNDCLVFAGDAKQGTA